MTRVVLTAKPPVRRATLTHVREFLDSKLFLLCIELRPEPATVISSFIEERSNNFRSCATRHRSETPPVLLGRKVDGFDIFFLCFCGRNFEVPKEQRSCRRWNNIAKKVSTAALFPVPTAQSSFLASGLRVDVQSYVRTTQINKWLTH